MPMTPRNRWQFPVDIPPARITPPGTRRPIRTAVQPVYRLEQRSVRQQRLYALTAGSIIGVGLFSWILAIAILVHYFSR